MSKWINKDLFDDFRKEKVEEKESSGSFRRSDMLWDTPQKGTVEQAKVYEGRFLQDPNGKFYKKYLYHMWQSGENWIFALCPKTEDFKNYCPLCSANAKLYKINMGRPLPVGSAARLIANLLFSARYMPLLTQALIGGIDDTVPHVFSLDPFGSVTEDKCVATGSGSPIAYGVLEDRYRDNMTVAELLPIIVKAVSAAMKRDVASGDSFNVATIDEKGFRELTDEEKTNLLTK